MAAQDTPGTVEWFQAVAHRAGVWPDMHAPIGIWKAVQRYYDAMQLPSAQTTVLFDDRPQNQRIAEAEERMRNPAPLQFEDEAAQPEAPAEPSDKPLGYVKFRAVQTLQTDGYCDGHEWLEFCKPGEIGDDKKPAFAVYASPQAAPAAQQPAELTDERIDAIAEIVVKGMPDGIQGFLKSWGWRQFARAILEDCAGHYAAPALTSPQPAEPVNRQLFDALQALHNHCEELKSQLDAVPPANRSACPISQGLTWHLATATRALQDASAPTAQQPEELGITPEMITAYLQANDAYWHDADSMPFNTRDPSKWRSGTPREATLAGLRAALAIIKAQGGSQ